MNRSAHLDVFNPPIYRSNPRDPNLFELVFAIEQKNRRLLLKLG